MSPVLEFYSHATHCETGKMQVLLFTKLKELALVSDLGMDTLEALPIGAPVTNFRSQLQGRNRMNRNGMDASFLV